MTLLNELKNLYNEEIETLGVILKGDVIVQLKNIHDNPKEGALMASQDVFDYLYSGNFETIATWHTHVNESADLSGEDYSSFLLHPQLDHYIVGNDGVKKYVIKDGMVLNG